MPHKNYKFLHIVSLDSNAAAYKSIGQFLTDKGWSVASGSLEFLSITTMFGSAGWKRLETAYRITIKGTDIKISSAWRNKDLVGVQLNMMGTKVDGGSPNDLTYHDGFQSVSKQVWNSIMTVLVQYPHTRIYYSLN